MTKLSPMQSSVSDVELVEPPPCIRVFFTTDNACVAPLSVTLTSLFESNRNHRLDLCIILVGVSSQNRSILCQLCQRLGVSATFIPFDMTAYASFPTCDTISTTAYARLFAGDLLPDDWHKAIYLDCDLLVRKDLTELWQTDIEDHPLAAVPTPCADRNTDLGMPADAKYFNSGVLLFNLQYWRKTGLQPRLADYIERNKDILKFHDQDAINGLMHSLIKPLPPRWNASHTFYLEPFTRLTAMTLSELQILRQDPSIVHFSGPSKPWRKNEYHPFQHAWTEVLKRTPFAEQYSEKASAAQFSAWCAKRFGRPVKRSFRATLHIARKIIRQNT